MKQLNIVNKKMLASLAAVGFLSVVGTAQADVNLSFSNSGMYSGTVAPGTDTSPWATATFADAGVDTVKLTMHVLNNLSAGAYVNDWYFNVNSAPLGSISYFSGVEATASPAGVVNGSDAFKADGAGKFDFAFHFNTSSPGQLGQGLSSVYTLTGTGITADSFNSFSTDSAKGSFLGAVHVQGYGGDQSAWVSAVPEPETYAMFLAGLGLMGFMARRCKNGQA